MTPNRSPLNRLVDLRERAVDRLKADLGVRQALQARYTANIERMERLCESTGASGAWQPAQSLNCAAYKQAVMLLAESHRADLERHESDMATAEHALQRAAREHESLAQVATRQQAAWQRTAEVAEQKRQDDMASQVWWRARA